MTDLLAAWVALAGRARLDDPGAGTGRELLDRWSERHRRYHDPGHLAAVLAVVDELAGEAPDPDAVALAGWFHDAVYDLDAQAGANERASAALARATLAGLGLAPARVDEVARLVLLTATHDPADADADGAVLCDADLAVLGGTPHDYDAYAAAVRDEYGEVDDDAFARGRAAVLRRLLGRQPLYATEAGRARYEARARENLERELAALG